MPYDIREWQESGKCQARADDEARQPEATRHMGHADAHLKVTATVPQMEVSFVAPTTHANGLVRNLRY